jgi:hypothetical protein
MTALHWAALAGVGLGLVCAGIFIGCLMRGDAHARSQTGTLALWLACFSGVAAIVFWWIAEWV